MTIKKLLWRYNTFVTHQACQGVNDKIIPAVARQAGSAKVVIMSKELSITDLGWQLKGLPWRYRLKLDRREQPVMVQSINIKESLRDQARACQEGAGVNS